MRFISIACRAPVRRTLLRAWGILIVLWTTPVMADYREGIDALNRGDYDRAVAELRPLAEDGNAQAQWALGYMYQHGLGVPKDPGRASLWRQRSVQSMLGERTERYPQPKATTRRPFGNGSGFVVDHLGRVVTNHHVVAKCDRIEVRSGPRSTPARLVSADPGADLALLAVGAAVAKAPAVFRPQPQVVLGETVLIAGYPLQGLLSAELHVTTGIVGALAGPGGDQRLIEINALVQPGSSGGPVLDTSGRVIAVVAGVMRTADANRAGAFSPMDQSFAVRGELLRRFLDKASIRYRVQLQRVLGTEAIAARARTHTVLVACLR